MCLAQISDALSGDMWGPNSCTVISLGCLCGTLAFGKHAKKLRRVVAVVSFICLWLSLFLLLGLRNLMIKRLVFYSFAELIYTIVYLSGRIFDYLSRQVCDFWPEKLGSNPGSRSDPSIKQDEPKTHGMSPGFPVEPMAEKNDRTSAVAPSNYADRNTKE
jgi:hypothetical protein